MPLFVIERVEVRESDLEAVVRVTDERFMRTSAAPGLAQSARELLPGLARHTCENGAGRDAMREFVDTESAHLLEHVAAELMALSGSPRDLRALTTWDFARDGRGVFRIRLEFDDDLAALGALSEAAEVVAWLLDGSGERPDVAAIVGRLREVRTASASPGTA